MNNTHILKQAVGLSKLKGLMFGGKGIKPSLVQAMGQAGAGGTASAIGGAMLDDEYDDKSFISKVLKGIGDFGLGAAGSVTGGDRFGLAGAAAGAGLGLGTSHLKTKAVDAIDQPVLKGLADIAGAGATTSLVGSLLSSSMLRGGGFRRVGEFLSDKFMDSQIRRSISNGETQKAEILGMLKSLMGDSSNINKLPSVVNVRKTLSDLGADERKFFNALVEATKDNASDLKSMFANVKGLEDAFPGVKRRLLDEDLSTDVMEMFRKEVEPFANIQMGNAGDLFKDTLNGNPGTMLHLIKALSKDPEQMSDVLSAGMRMGDQRGIMDTARKLNSPGSRILGDLISYNFGSPNVARAVSEHGSIQNIPALQYLAANVKDIGGGALAGLPLAPLFSPFALYDALTAKEPTLKDKLNEFSTKMKSYAGQEV